MDLDHSGCACTWFSIFLYCHLLILHCDANGAAVSSVATRVWRGFPFLYIAIMFVLVPIVFLGISTLFTEDTKGFTVLGSFITIILGIGVFWTVYWFKFREARRLELMAS
jgi:cytochrome c biogenesis protein CcdA